MAKKFKLEEKFDVPRGKLFEFLTDPETKKTEALDFGGALESEATREEPGSNKVRVVVKSKVYSRGMDGKKDMSKTETATFVEDWDAAKFESTWNYRMEKTFGDRVKVEGKKKLVAKGDDACMYIDETSVDVNVPMIGGMIAGKVLSSLERSQPRLMEWMKKKLNER